MSLRAATTCLALLFATGAHAAPDCAKEKLGEFDTASSYLLDYARSCTAKEAQAALKRWEIPDVPHNKMDEKQRRANFSRTGVAWQEIVVALDRLVEDAKSAPLPSQSMREIYEALPKRARAAGAAVVAEVEPPMLQFNPSRGDGWGLDALELKEFSPELPGFNVAAAVDNECASKQSELCVAAIRRGKAMMVQWRLAYMLTELASYPTIAAVAKQVETKEKLWKQYVYDSKPMLPLDFIVSDAINRTWAQSDQYPEGFRVPPRVQWFALHPAAAVEYVDGALDGQQMKPILYLEVFGFNLWNPKDHFLKASGASLIISYADRDGIKDTGYGAVFTFSNVYTLGVARYGSKTGVFLSLDLANLWRDKYKPEYEKYKNTYEQLKAAPR